MKKTPKEFHTIDGVVVATWQESGLFFASFTAKAPGGRIVRFKTEFDPEATKEKLLNGARNVIRRDSLYKP